MGLGEGQLVRPALSLPEIDPPHLLVTWGEFRLPRAREECRPARRGAIVTGKAVLSSPRQGGNKRAWEAGNFPSPISICRRIISGSETRAGGSPEPSPRNQPRVRRFQPQRATNPIAPDASNASVPGSGIEGLGGATRSKPNSVIEPVQVPEVPAAP